LDIKGKSGGAGSQRGRIGDKWALFLIKLTAFSNIK